MLEEIAVRLVLDGYPLSPMSDADLQQEKNTFPPERWAEDDIGARMWQLLAEHGDVTTVAEQLLEYDVDGATLRRDLAKLIAWLAGEGFIAVDQT